MKETDGEKVLLGCIAMIALLPALALLNGWVLLCLWEWFVIPAFGVSAITIWQAIGIDLLVSLLTHQHQHGAEERKVGEMIAVALFRPLWVWLIAYVLHFVG